MYVGMYAWIKSVSLNIDFTRLLLGGGGGGGWGMLEGGSSFFLKNVTKLLYI